MCSSDLQSGRGHDLRQQLVDAVRAVQQHGGATSCLLQRRQSLRQIMATPALPTRATAQMDLRTYGIGAQILRDLGIRRMKLLGSPRRMPSMTGYGLEVTGFVSGQA